MTCCALINLLSHTPTGHGRHTRPLASILPTSRDLVDGCCKALLILEEYAFDPANEMVQLNGGLQPDETRL
jgi:hypothetical protein